MFNGGRIGFSSGNGVCDTLFSDLKALNPTFFFAPPSFWNSLYSQYCSTNQQLAHLRFLLGTRIIWLGTGGSSISPEVLAFIQRIFGVHCAVGYGTTEAGPISSDSKILTSNSDIKLVDVPSLGYKASEGKGEVCVRSRSSIGYWKNPTATSEVFLSDNFIRTGDIAEMLPDGTLKVIDRISAAFKLTRGEFVAPSIIESNLLTKCTSAQHILIHHSPDSEYTIAIVQPTHSALSTLGNQLEEHLKKQIYAACDAIQLQAFERPRVIIVITDDWEQIGMLTPSLKLKRHLLIERYSALITQQCHYSQCQCSTPNQVPCQESDPGCLTSILVSLFPEVPKHDIRKWVADGLSFALLPNAADSIRSVRFLFALKILLSDPTLTLSFVCQTSLSELEELANKQNQVNKVKFYNSTSSPEINTPAQPRTPIPASAPQISGAAGPNSTQELFLSDCNAIPCLLSSSYPLLGNSVLVTGATGFIGQAVVEELLARLSTETIFCVTRKQSIKEMRCKYGGQKRIVLLEIENV